MAAAIKPSSSLKGPVGNLTYNKEFSDDTGMLFLGTGFIKSLNLESNDDTLRLNIILNPFLDSDGSIIESFKKKHITVTQKSSTPDSCKCCAFTTTISAEGSEEVKKVFQAIQPFINEDCKKLDQYVQLSEIIC